MTPGSPQLFDGGGALARDIGARIRPPVLHQAPDCARRLVKAPRQLVLWNNTFDIVGMASGPARSAWHCACSRGTRRADVAVGGGGTAGTSSSGASLEATTAPPPPRRREWCMRWRRGPLRADRPTELWGGGAAADGFERRGGVGERGSSVRERCGGAAAQIQEEENTTNKLLVPAVLLLIVVTLNLMAVSATWTSRSLRMRTAEGGVRRLGRVQGEDCKAEGEGAPTESTPLTGTRKRARAALLTRAAGRRRARAERGRKRGGR